MTDQIDMIYLKIFLYFGLRLSSGTKFYREISND